MYLTEHLIAYLDILGFGQLVEDSSTNPSLEAEIIEILQNLRDKRLPFETSNTGKRMSAFSDSIVISIPKDSQASVYRMLRDVINLQNRILKLGYCMRGAIVLGPLYHHDGILFGKGLIEAYELERGSAKFPRVLISPEIIAFGKHQLDPADPNYPRFAAFLSKQNIEVGFGFSVNDPQDSQTFVNYLTFYGLKETQERKIVDDGQRNQRYLRLRQTILERMSEIRQYPERLAKWQWLAFYFNSTIRNLNLIDSNLELIPNGMLQEAALNNSQ